MPAANFSCTAEVSDDALEVTISVTNNSQVVDSVRAFVYVWVIDPQPPLSYVETRFNRNLYYDSVPAGKTIKQVLQTDGWFGGGTNVWKVCAKLMDN